MLTIHNVSGNLNFFAQVCEMGGIPNLGETPVLVRPMQNCAASLRTPFVRRQSNRKLDSKRGVSSLLRIPPQNWGDVLNFERKFFQMCPKLDRPLRRI